MEPVEMKYSKQDIERAGRVLLEGGSDTDQAWDVLSNWRAFHHVPLTNFYIRLRTSARAVCSESLVSRRLKRASSIISKIKRMGVDKMNPYIMQDIGGCRAIVDNVVQVRRIFDEYYDTGKYAKHKRGKISDYITNPRDTGYRSLHIVYTFQEEGVPYNGRHIEIQLRTKLQHAWATAVETVETFTHESLRTAGEKRWQVFFKLVSSAFAMLEGTSLVPGVTSSELLLQERISDGMKILSVRDTLTAYIGAIKIIKERKIRSAKKKHYVLALNPMQRTLLVRGYSEREFARASAENLRLEKEGLQSVLVGGDSLRAVTKAFPNYWLDTTFFLESIDRFLALKSTPLFIRTIVDTEEGGVLAWGEEPEEEEQRGEIE